jgi:iron complex transport system permease protein
MRLVLNGVAIQAGINACMTLLIINLDDSQFEFITKWQAGNIWGANWKMVISLLPWIIVGSIILLFNAKNLDILSMGDDISYGLGVAVSREKGKLLFTAIGLAAASVAISGSISFVGLIAPHLGRRLVGAKHKFLIPACSMIGALLVLSADTIARIIIMPSELPTGIVVSVLGAPYFIFLLIRSRNASKKTSGGNYETN